jgi:hypothetical protein
MQFPQREKMYLKTRLKPIGFSTGNFHDEKSQLRTIENWDLKVRMFMSFSCPTAGVSCGATCE